MNYRSLRVAELIRDELGKLLVRDLEFGSTLVTITEVRVTDKLDHAKVLVSILPEAEVVPVLKILHDAQGELQHKLLKKINIKPMPRIAFELDRGPENAAKIEKALLKEKRAN